jgi:septum formation protein
MYRNREPIILASESPRRQQFLMEMGLDFSIRSAFVDELPAENEGPEDFVRRMAWEKAAAVSTMFPESWVISGDTVVCLGNRILGKPADKEEAVALLLLLSGREHSVKTGFCVSHGTRGVKIVRSVTTRVCFSDYSEAVAHAYVATGESLDKAGAYGIQGRGGLLVKTIAGSYSNVVGLPLHELMEVLEENGIIELSATAT